MSQVRFLKGTQSNLLGLNSYTEGAFYLTTDTDRLYFAQASNELVPLNQFIRTVDQIEAESGKTSLPTNANEGDYYYAAKENVLCIRDGNSWTQLNPDTNTRLKVSTAALTSAAGTNTNEVKINLNVSEAENTVPTGGTANTATGSVTVKGGNGVTVAQSNNEITISADSDINTQYEIDTDSVTGLESGESGAKIVLDADSSGTDSDITLKSSNRYIGIAQNNGVITLTALDQSVDTVTAGFDANGKFKVTVKDATDASAVASTEIEPTVTYGQTGSKSTAKFLSGSADLDVYTTSQTDNKISAALSAADAMTYKGTVSHSNSSDLTNNAPWGSVYKVSGVLTEADDGITAKVGDLVIAEKAEGQNIVEGAANSTTWVVVPSGDDQTITFTKDSTTGQILIADGVNGAGIKIAAGTHAAVSHALSGNTITTTVSQAQDYTAQDVEGSTADVTQTRGSDTSFTAITAIETDAYGNVVDGSIKTKTFNVSGGAKVDTVTEQITHTVSGATVTTLVKDTASAVAKSGSYSVSSDNLTITNGTNDGTTASANLKINLEWGSF